MNNGLRTKLFGALILVGLIPIIAGSLTTLISTKKSIEKNAYSNLEAIRELKKAQILDYFQQIENTLKWFSTNESVGEATYLFSEEWNALKRTYGNGTERHLQNLFIFNNPYPTGEKEKLVKAADGSKYSELHARYHPWYRQVLEDFGYYDLFLFDTDGNMIYSVFKELDYATNFVNGKYASSGLGEAFQKANKLSEGKFVLVDFRSYEPSYGDPASFIAAPVFHNGRRVGVFAKQMPIDRVNAIMLNRTGQGETGETYLVGADGLLRSDSYRSPERYTVKATYANAKELAIKSSTFKSALEGKSSIELTTSYLGDEVLSAYAPIDVFGLKWVIKSEITSAEALRELKPLYFQIVGLFLGMTILIIIIAYVVTGSIERPMTGILEQVREVMDQFKSMSNQLNENSEALAVGASEQASAMEETSASISEIAASSKSNLEISESAKRTAEEMKNSADKGAEELEALKNTIMKIKQSADQSSIIIKNIDEIAFQTNLLALNAAVEAARAGAMGASFAVVADEVRRLALRTAEAARQTEEIISGSMISADQSFQKVTQYEQLLKAIYGSSNKVNQILDEIQQAATEQAQGTQQVSLGISQSEKIIQSNAASAEELSSSAQEMLFDVSKLDQAIIDLEVLIKGKSSRVAITVN